VLRIIEPTVRFSTEHLEITAEEAGLACSRTLGEIVE
jgi:hypothetical protein